MSKDQMTIEEIKAFALQTKLALTDEEAEDLQDRLAEIDQAADRLGQVDTTGVEPTWFGNDVRNVLRPDEPVKTETREDLFKNVPEQDTTDFIEVPAMIDDGKEGA